MGDVKDVKFKGIPGQIDTCWDNKKVPLFLDSTDKTMQFLKYSGQVFAAKGLVVKKAQGTPVQELHEELRDALVAGMKYGNILVIDCANAAPDFLGQWCHPEYFPVEAFNPALYNPGEVLDCPELNKIIPEDQKTSGMFVVKDAFRIVIHSQFEPADAVEFLAPVLPLDHVEAFAVQH